MPLSQTHHNINLLPLSVIAKATSGDIGSINKVLKHYEDYIIVLSTRYSYDKYGNAHLFLDEYLHNELKNKLVTRILSFNIT